MAIDCHVHLGYALWREEILGELAENGVIARGDRARELKKVRELDISEGEKRRVLHDNIARLLRGSLNRDF